MKYILTLSAFCCFLNYGQAQNSSFPDFPADRYHEFQIDPAFINQFLSAHCAATSHHEATTGMFRFYHLNQHYPTMAQLPFSIFFQPAGETKIFYLSRGFCRGHHITVPVKYQGTYYVTINDTQKPAILIIHTDSPNYTAEFRVGCTLHQGFNIQYLNRSAPPQVPSRNHSTSPSNGTPLLVGN